MFLLEKNPRFFLSKFTGGADVSTAHGLIKAGLVSTLGKIHFIPEASCAKDANSDDCYLGIPLNTAGRCFLDLFTFFNLWLDILVKISLS